MHDQGKSSNPGANPTTLSYNDSVVKIYSATNSTARFCNIFFWYKNALAYYVQRWRCSCKFSSRRCLTTGYYGAVSMRQLLFQRRLSPHACNKKSYVQFSTVNNFFFFVPRLSPVSHLITGTPKPIPILLTYPYTP
jgi:hypothetical protein